MESPTSMTIDELISDKIDDSGVGDVEKKGDLERKIGMADYSHESEKEVVQDENNEDISDKDLTLDHNEYSNYEDDNQEDSDKSYEADAESREADEEGDEREESRKPKKKNKRPSLNERRERELEERRARERALQEEVFKLSNQVKYLRDTVKTSTSHLAQTEEERYLDIISEAKREYEQAAEYGDTDAQFRAMNVLMEAKMQAKELQEQKKNLQSYWQDSETEEEPLYFGQDYYNEPEQQQSNPVVDDFLRKNPWVNNPHVAPIFEQTMNEIAPQWVISGREDPYSDPKFFNEVSRKVRNKFGVKSVPNPESRNVASGISHDSYYEPFEPRANPKRPWERIKLTPHQERLADKIMGMNEAAQGKPLSTAQKIERYKKNLYYSPKTNTMEI